MSKSVATSSAAPATPEIASSNNASTALTNGTPQSSTSSHLSTSSAPHLRFKSFLDMLVIGVIAGGLVALYFRLNQIDARLFFLERRSSESTASLLSPPPGQQEQQPRSFSSSSAENGKRLPEQTCVVQKNNDDKYLTPKIQPNQAITLNAVEEQQRNDDGATDTTFEEEEENGVDEDVPHVNVSNTSAATGSYLTPK